MGNDYFTSTVVRVGSEAADMIAGGMLILYADPIPEALEDVSIVHSPSAPLQDEDELCAGDSVWFGDHRAEVIDVGSRATENLRTLGHVVVHLNPDASTQLLPGAVHARGDAPAVKAGTRLAFRATKARK
jgi:glucitol/sorbitol PTS system EIIA component